MSQLLPLFLSARSVTTDSRNIPQGSMFFALKGDRFNGNDFVHAALDAGAAFAIADEDRNWHDSRILVVPDVLLALQELAASYRQTLHIPVIGLTGSNGKTTSKELMAAALGSKYRVAATKGNLNNHIGVPLTLLAITAEHEVAIVEMGANHQGEIAMLSAMAQPDYGFITNYGKAHLEGFGGVEGVIKGKSELYVQLQSTGKKALVNIQDPKQMEKSSTLERITFGTSKDADYPIFPLQDGDRVGIRVGSTETWTQLTGAYNFTNVAAAYAMAVHLGCEPENALRGIANYTPTNNRSQKTKTDKNLLILDCYNANPSSMEAALSNFASIAHPHKLAILGDMFELGAYTAEEHAKVLEQLKRLEIPALLAGEAFLGVGASTFPSFSSTAELKAYLEKKSLSDHLILLKGSRSMALEQLVPVL